MAGSGEKQELAGQGVGWGRTERSRSWQGRGGVGQSRERQELAGQGLGSQQV